MKEQKTQCVNENLSTTHIYEYLTVFFSTILFPNFQKIIQKNEFIFLHVFRNAQIEAYFERMKPVFFFVLMHHRT